jgi:ABC-type multidrug transport system permease subunit
VSVRAAEGRWGGFRSEIAKLPAFARRDLLIAWSYKLPFITDWLGLIVQVVIFQFVGKLVRPELVPAFQGSRATYMEFVAVGIAISSITGIALVRVYSVMRQEQLQGTLESLLLTPTSSTTIELGSVVYDVAYVPVRMALFFVLTSILVGADFSWFGLVAMMPLVLVFVAFAWGLGIMAAAWTVTFKRGTGAIGLLTTVLTLGSGAYFPLAVLPGWARALAEVNPMAIALQGARDALLGGASFAEIAPQTITLVPFAIAFLLLGNLGFRAALARERRRGTLGLY